MRNLTTMARTSSGSVRSQFFWLILFLAVTSSGLSWWRTRKQYFWQDDFIFLIQAKQSTFSWDLFSKPLFTHFSPVAWCLHFLVANNGMSWGLAQLIMIFIVGLSALTLGYLVMLLGGSKLASSVAVVAYGTSVIHLRSMAWWSAFVQDMPLVALLFVGLIFWYLSLRKTTWWAICGTLFFCLLSGFAYEPGYLYPLFIAAFVALLYSSGVRPEGNRLILIATFFGCVVICLALFLYHKLNYAGLSPGHSWSDVLRLVGAFLGASTGPLMIGLAPSTTWPPVIVGALFVLAPFVIGAIVLGRKGVFFATAWGVPYFALAGALAYARAGFDLKSGVPGYPRDYQYHGLSTAWTILCLVLLIEQLAKCKYKTRHLRFTICLLLFSNVSISSQAMLATKVAMNSNENLVSRKYAQTMQGLPNDDVYFVDRRVPVILEQFGGYARLFSAREVFGSSSTPVLSGTSPIWIDDQGNTRKLREDRILTSTVLGAESIQRCVQPLEDWTRILFEPIEQGSILSIQIRVVTESERLEVLALLGSHETQIVWPLGYITGHESSLSFEVPNTYSGRTNASSLPLNAVQIIGLSRGSSICFGSVSILRVLP